MQGSTESNLRFLQTWGRRSSHPDYVERTRAFQDGSEAEAFAVEKGGHLSRQADRFLVTYWTRRVPLSAARAGC